MYKSIRAFYNSTQWKTTRELYKKSKQGLCERCLKMGLTVPAEEIHHKIRLTKDNINDPKITLSFDNLEALCISCHDKEHEHDQRNRYGSRYREQRRYFIDNKTGKVLTK